MSTAHLCLLVAVLLGAGLPGGAASQAAEDFLSRTADPAARSRQTRHLTLTLSAEPPVAPGSRLTLSVDVAPRSKMHVYAPDQKDVIPVALLLEPTEGVRAASPRYPPSEPYFFAPLEETQRVYSRPFRITQVVTIADTPAVRQRARVPGATLAIRGRVRYQACDEAVCYLPEDVPVSWRVALVPAAP